VHALLHPNVHLREEGEDVDGTEESDGEVLVRRVHAIVRFVHE
jgi:hypothetical protein